MGLQSAFTVVLLASTLGHGCGNPSNNNPYVEEFKQWMSTYGVTFSTKGEFQRRLEIFAQNSDFITEHNNANGGSPSYTLGHNQFSHLTWEEFKSTHLGYRRRPSPEKDEGKEVEDVSFKVSRRGLKSDAAKLRTSLPNEVDWTAEGAVTPVQNQGMCGSCWAFSAIGAMEGAYFLKTQNLVKFSEEQLVDCDKEERGCLGGDMAQAFDWIRDNGGVCPEDEYPYAGLWPPFKTCKDSTCALVPGSAVSGWEQANPDDEALMEAVARQPISVGIEANKLAFQLYQGGVFTAACGSNLDHGVLLVGYGTSEDGVDYWKVKNSWGETWGMDGYILLRRGGQDEPEMGECGILMEATYPVLEDGPEAAPGGSGAGGIESSHALGGLQHPDGLQSSAVATDCGKGTTSMIFDDVEVTPSEPERGSPVSLVAHGTLTRPMASGSYALGVKMGSTSVYSHTGSLCGDTTANLPLGLGKIDMHGFPCPSNPGPVDYSLELTLPGIAPPGVYDISLTGTDETGTSALCLDVKLKL